MTLAIYTDAGIKDGVATWAFVVVGDGAALFEASGRLRVDTNCTATAECRAIANALHRAMRAGHLPVGASVRIFSDSRHAVDRIEGRLKRRPESGMAKAVEVIHRYRAGRALMLKAQWIPGHKPDDHSPHARWNNRCDALCRAARNLPRPSPARKALDAARRLALGA